MGIDLLEIRVEAKPVSTGRGSDPQMVMRYSHDGGHSWSNEITRSVGRIGEYAKRIQWNRLGIGSEWLFEFTFVEPIEYAIIGASASISEVEL